jgi:HlyD family secretion protein
MTLAAVPPIEPTEHQVPEELRERLSTLDNPAVVPPRPKRTWTPVALGVLVLGIVAASSYWGWQHYNTPEGPPKNLETQALIRGDIVLTFVEKGELEAARNTEIVCQVRASGRGSTAATSIKWVIDDGSKVKKGDLLMLLEDASLREQLNNQRIVVDEKLDLYEQARTNLKITENENRSTELTALSNYKIAEIDLEKFRKAERQQKQFDIDSRIKLATADLIQWRDKLGWSNRMFVRGYLSANQKLNDETRLDQANVNLDKLQKEFDTLQFDNRRQELDLQTKLDQAKLQVEIAKENSESKRSQALAKLTSAELILKQETQKRDDDELDVRNCKIFAPHDGMVIYFISDSARFGGSSQTSPVEVGSPIKEGQKLMRIPNLSRMIAKVKVHESIVTKLRGDTTAPTGFGTAYDVGQVIMQWGHIIHAQAVPGFHSALPAFMPGLIMQREVKSDLSNLEEVVTEYGMPANIKVASVEKPLSGHVKMVSSVASSNDWMSADVKVYQTVVAIDETPEVLKPNMSAEVTVKIDERKNVLQLPIQAVLESGGEKFCYVKTETNVEKRIVKTGLNNYKFVEVLPESNIRENELIVLNARSYAEKVNDLKGNVNIDPSNGMRDRANPKTPAKAPVKMAQNSVPTKSTAPEKPMQQVDSSESNNKGLSKERSAKGAGN